MDVLIMELMAYFFGKIYLYFRYSSKEKRQQVLKDEYDNHYGNVLGKKALQLLVVLFLIGIVVLFFIAINSF